MFCCGVWGATIWWIISFFPEKRAKLTQKLFSISWHGSKPVGHGSRNMESWPIQLRLILG